VKKNRHRGKSPKKVAKQSRSISPPISSPSQSQPQPHRLLWRATKWTIATTVSVLGLLAVIDQLWGRPWPTDPEIHPRDSVDASTFILPFVVRNKSMFSMPDVEFRCGVQLLYFSDADGKTGIISGAAIASDPYTVPTSPPINYRCNASDLIDIKPDGSVTMRDSLGTMRGVMRAPLKILKMCVWVGGRYKFMGLRWTFRSQTFQWPAAPGKYQWIEGPMLIDPSAPQSSDAWDPALDCSNPSLNPEVYIVFGKRGQPAIIEPRHLRF
jgi:hypothetical protein